MRRIFRLKSVLWVLAAGVMLVALLMAVAWWRLPWLLTRVGEVQLAGLGLEEGELRVTEAGASRVVVEALVLGDQGWRIAVERAEFRFSLEALWSEGQLESVLVEGVRVQLEETWLREALRGAEGEATEDTELDLSMASALPMDLLEIKDGELVARLEGGREHRLGWEGEWKRSESGGAEAKLQLKRGASEVEVRGEVGGDGEGRLEVAAAMPEPIGILEAYLPDWRERVEWPNGTSLAVGPLRASGEARLAQGGGLQWSGEAVLGRLEIADAERELIAKEVRLEAEAGEAGRVKGRLAVDLLRGAYVDFALAEQTIELQVTEGEGAEWQVRTASPVAWLYDAGEVSGRAEELAARLQLARELELEGAGRVSDLQAHGVWAEPVEVRFAGSLERIDFDVSQIVLRDYASVQVSGGKGTVNMPETGPVELTFEGEVMEDVLRFALPELTTGPLRLKARVETEDEVLNSKIGLKALQEDRLLSYGDALSVTGQWSAELEADTEDDGALWKLKLRQSSSGVEMAGGGWAASGLGSELDLEIENLDTAIFEEENLPLARLIEALLGKSVAKITLQANEIEAGAFAAQWLGASLELTASEESPGALMAILEGNAGVVEAATETLRQVDLKSEARGSLAELEVEGGMDFMYEGLDGRLSFKHEATQPNSSELAWNLRGSYSLSPLVFDYSDLLSQRIDALHGLSFSGALSAKGEYWLEEGAFDASGEATFAEGSVSQPGSQLSMEGIEMALAMESFREMRAKPESSRVSIERIQLGDLVARDARLRFDLESLDRLRVRQAVASAFGGELALQPGTVDLEELDYKGRLRFERISLAEVTGMISFFNGSMEGAVSGFLPLEIEDGQLQLGEGRLELASGETALLRYNAKGLLTDDGQTGKGPSMSDRVLGLLEVEPESMVERSLGNFEITRLLVRLFPEEQANTPLQIELAGVGRTEKADLPLNVQVNVNGSLDELYMFLIRLNSLGSASLEVGR